MSLRDSRSVEPLVEPLTRREREVLGLLAQGLTASEIAEKLTLAASSVKWHVQQLYGKLGVNNKQRALLRAAELGLIAPQPSAPVETPQRRSDPRHNLPLQFTRFFGRETELVQLKARLAEHRLVTLTGPGGVGKTRLALRAAEDLVDDFANGVWFVGLASLTDPALAVQTVTTSLGLRDEPGRPIIETVIDFLRPRQVLAVLDNCEHLLEACAQVADQLLRACPRLTILASSREPLGVDGEAVFAVPSLPFPAAGARPEAARLADYEAVRLFTDRARLVAPEFAVTPGNAAAVARICQRLDGIPLALEMAAARLNVLSAEQLADRLDDAFRLLTGNNRTALPRQQTLRATLDWSYRLLNDEQRLLLQRLSVFAGGCALEAAEVVCADYNLPAANVLEPLASLVARSLVIADQQPGEETRYRLLEIVRQYAREKLHGAGEGVRLFKRHRDYYLKLAEFNFPQLNGTAHRSWKRKLVAERDNFRHALEWSFSDESEIEAGPRLLSALAEFDWCPFEEYADWLNKGVAWCQSHHSVPREVYASILRLAAGPVAQNDPQAAGVMVEQTIEICRQLGSEGRWLLLRTLLGVGVGILELRGDAAPAEAPLAESEALLEELALDGLPSELYLWQKAWTANAKSHLRNRQRRYPDAIVHARESIQLFEAIADDYSAILPLINLGGAQQSLGEFQAARETFLRAQSLIEEIGHREKAFVLRWLAVVDVGLSNLDRALAQCRDSLQVALGMPDRNTVASGLGVCAIIAAKQGQPLRAARLSAAAKRLYARQKRNHWEDSSLDTLLPGWRESPEQPAISAAYEVGLAMTYDEAVAYALSDD